MDAVEITNVCRLCPSSGGGEDLLNVFDQRLSVKNNMKEVILVTTGIEIQENDLITKKICHKCCTKTLQMFLFRQDALMYDRALKEKCSRLLEDKGLRLPNTCITIKRERRDSCTPIKRPKVEMDDFPYTPVISEPKKILHPSVMDIYKNNPRIKIPKKCLNKHLAPVVSFNMGEVEKYFKIKNLEMRKFVYKVNAKKTVNAVAKKRTSFPAKPKTVSPIKICRKTIENYEVQNEYVCTSVDRNEKCKEAINFLDGDKPSKCPNDTEATETQSLVTTEQTPKSTKNVVDKIQISVKEPIAPVSEAIPITSISPSVPIIDPILKGNEETYLNQTSKPLFIESLGLTPTVTATKSKTLHVCNLCGSVHNNAFKLKTHSRKHMVCQFCKLRFKSIETKQEHVDNLCQVKEILNSAGPFVDLKKIHLDILVREKYRNAFSSFEAIPGLKEPDSKQQEIPKTTPLTSPAKIDSNVVVETQQEHQQQTKFTTEKPGVQNGSIAHSTVTVVKPDVRTKNDVVKPDVRIKSDVVRPDVRIKNDVVTTSIAEDTTEQQFIKDLLLRIKPKRPRTINKVLQTDLPATKDIKINTAEGYCEFKNLKEQILFYKIPVSITDGPFHVAYQYKNASNPTKDMALWDDLTLIDTQRLQSTQISAPVPHNPTKHMSNSKSLHFSSGTISSQCKITTDQTCNNSNSTTTLLTQRLTKQTTVSLPAVIPKINNISVSSNSTVMKKNLSKSSVKQNNNLLVSSVRKSLPGRISKQKIQRSSSLRSSSQGLTQQNSKIGKLGAELTSNSNLSSISSKSDMSRFRVKNVWELQ